MSFVLGPCPVPRLCAHDVVASGFGTSASAGGRWSSVRPLALGPAKGPNGAVPLPRMPTFCTETPLLKALEMRCLKLGRPGGLAGSGAAGDAKG